MQNHWLLGVAVHGGLGVGYQLACAETWPLYSHAKELEVGSVQSCYGVAS